MILLIDNYDSFVYNLARYFERCGATVCVKRHDECSLQTAIRLKPTHLVISPGPSGPEKTGISRELIKYFMDKIPILGVCLGHQLIATCFNHKVACMQPMHGKASKVSIVPDDIFKKMPSQFQVGRYHSLGIVGPISYPLKLIAMTELGEIMAIRHQVYPIYGLQFHPESILTEYGQQMIQNFFEINAVMV